MENIKLQDELNNAKATINVMYAEIQALKRAIADKEIVAAIEQEYEY
ncbi:MAG: hypothetical protein SOY94_11675 [Candidatus Limiplasma sp.]|jgi:hypothetical protein|nr:hypothetical protein [Candidatus Limiplasma sp.]